MDFLVVTFVQKKHLVESNIECILDIDSDLLQIGEVRVLRSPIFRQLLSYSQPGDAIVDSARAALSIDWQVLKLTVETIRNKLTIASNSDTNGTYLDILHFFL